MSEQLPEWTELDNWQVDAMLAAVLPSPDLPIEIVSASHQSAQRLANDLSILFDTIGIRTSFDRLRVVSDASAGFEVVTPDVSSPGVVALCKGLTTAGLSPDIKLCTGVGCITIIVGERPKTALPSFQEPVENNAGKGIAICAIFRDEAPYILEWIAHHLLIGFDHIVLYDNNSRDDGARLLCSGSLNQRVTLIDWQTEPGQLDAYQHYIDNFRDVFAWTAFIDIDEFIHILDGRGIKDVLGGYEAFAGILVQWLMFGSSGWESRPGGLIVDNYVWRMPDDAEGNLHVKTIARNHALLWPGATPHTFELQGPVCNAIGQECPNVPIQQRSCHDNIVINHYFTKSRQEWLQKVAKGKATTTRADEQYHLGMFDHVAVQSTVRDERLKDAVAGRLVVGLARVSAPSQRTPRVASWLGAAARPRRPLIFDNVPGGHYANLMLKYMAAAKLTQRFPGTVLSNFVMPYWGIDFPPLPLREGDQILKADDEQHLDMDHIESLAVAGLVDRIEWTGYGQRMENFPDLEVCRRIFSAPDTDRLGDTFGSTDLVCPIRGGEILDGRHGGYTLLPVSFYREITDKLGLRPVFVGELDANPYTDALRQAFPDGLFSPRRDALWNFQTIRKARNIVVCVSTFAWLAAWLSRAEKIILPIYGLYNPRQFINHDLLPVGDTRYTYYEFPIHWAVPVDQVLQAHRQIEGAWQPCQTEKFGRVSPPAAPRNVSIMGAASHSTQTDPAMRGHEAVNPTIEELLSTYAKSGYKITSLPGEETTQDRLVRMAQGLGMWPMR